MTKQPHDTNSSIQIKRYDEHGNSICDPNNKQEDLFEYSSKKRFIIPPGLIQNICEFRALLEVAHGKPILITGPTGVGKSLFLHMFEEWHKANNSKGEIVTVNCSHFEKELARSELFGHVKGAFTGAISEKVGWVEKADDGCLILEEIGELSNDCQAKLLTLIEDGKFHKVGSNIIKQVKNISIIGATNRKKADFREDFWNRFIIFSLPPLYQRRGDILYYIEAKYPEMIKSLQPWEVLALLCYNWPGNVREIDRVILNIKTVKRLKEMHSSLKLSDSVYSNLACMDENNTDLSIFQSLQLQAMFYESECMDYAETFESILNKYCVGISTDNNLCLLNNDNDDNLLRSSMAPPLELIQQVKEAYENLFKIEVSPNCAIFDHAFVGFKIFCELFCQPPDGNQNCILVFKNNVSPLYAGNENITQNNPEMFQFFRTKAFEFISGIKLPKDTMIPLDDEGLVAWFVNLQTEYPNNKYMSTFSNGVQDKKEKDSGIDIFTMTEKEFTKYYYEGLQKRYPTTRKIAEILDIKEQTMYSKFKSLKKEGIIS